MLAHPAEIVSVMLVAQRFMHKLTCGHPMHYRGRKRAEIKGVYY